MKRITHHDQIRLVSEMQGWFNIGKSIYVIILENEIKRKQKYVVIL